MLEVMYTFNKREEMTGRSVSYVTYFSLFTTTQSFIELELFWCLVRVYRASVDWHIINISISWELLCVVSGQDVLVVQQVTSGALVVRLWSTNTYLITPKQPPSRDVIVFQCKHCFPPTPHHLIQACVSHRHALSPSCVSCTPCMFHKKQPGT